MALDIRQSLSYTPEQRARLVTLVNSDAEAIARCTEMLQEAEARLERAPRPLRVIHFEGLLNTEPARIETSQHLNDMDDLALFVFAYAASDVERFAEKICAYVLAWAGAYEPTGNPINERMLEPLLAGYELLLPDWELGQKQAIEHWMRQMAVLEIQSAHERPRSTTNNWHTKRLSLVGQIGLLLNDEEYIKYAVDGFRTYIGVGLYPDGSTEDFHRRDALSYHQSGLKPLLVLARMLQTTGIELFDQQSTGGACIRRSLDFMIPYLDGTLVHFEWVNTQSEIDKRRAAAGIPFYQTGKPYDPHNALELVELATHFNPDYRKVVRMLTGSSAQRYPTWLTVASAV